VPLVVSATFVRASYLLAFAVLSDAKHSHSIAVASGLGAALNVLLNLWLIPAWGLTGAAATTLVAYGVMSLVALRRSERIVGESLHIGRLVQVWLVAVGVMLLLSALPTDAIGWTARGLLALIVGFAALVALIRTRTRYVTVMAQA
jgi:O-antigen/teichoic acid export membrane protein